MAAAAEWAFHVTVRNVIRLFATGHIPLPDVRSYFETFARYWHIKVPKEVRNADPLFSVWEFIAIFTTIPADECNELGKGSFDRLLDGISRLESALKYAISLSASEGKGVTKHLEKLLGRVVGHTVMAFSHDKHQSRILYNQYKSMMTRHQQQGCELVLKGLLPASKVLQSQSEYLKTVKELLENIVNSTFNLIDYVSEKAMNNCSHSDNSLKWLIEDTDVESSDESEVRIIASDGQINEEYVASRILKQNNDMEPKKRKHPSNHASTVSGGDVIIVADSNSKTHKTRLPDDKLMPPPLFVTKSKSQSKIPSASKKRQNINKPPKLPVIFRKPGKDIENKSVTSSSTSYSTRTKHSFTPLQDAYIIFGMMKYRDKKQLWSEIHKKYPFPEYRTPTHLKDRWRTLLKRGEVHMEGEKIIASPKYEAILKHLYTKFEKDNKWEWKGKQRSKRRLITLDEDEELDDVSIDDHSDDSDLPKQHSSSRSAVLEWLDNNSGIPGKEARPPTPVKEVTENDKPETSGTFVKSHENGEIMHFSDDETPPDTGQVILMPSKDREYIENVHGKFLPNSINKTSTDLIQTNPVNSQNANLRPFNNSSTDHPNDNPTNTSAQCQPESISSVENDIEVPDPNFRNKDSAQDSEHVRIEHDSKTNDIKSTDTPQKSLSPEELLLVDEITSRPSLDSDIRNTNGDSTGEKSDVSMSCELLKLTEQSLHCELMREEDISFVSTESDTTAIESETTAVQMERNVSKASPELICGTSNKPISSVSANDSQNNSSRNFVQSHENRSKIDCRFQPLEYPASSTGTSRTVSPASSSVYMTADDDSEFGTDSGNNERTLCADETTQMSNTPTNMANCYCDKDPTPGITRHKEQTETIQDSRALTKEANLGFNDSRDTSNILSSTQINSHSPSSSPVEQLSLTETCIDFSDTRTSTSCTQKTNNSINQDTSPNMPHSMQQHGTKDNDGKQQTIRQNPSAKKQKRSKDDEMQKLHHSILTRQKVAQIRASQGLSNSLIHERVLRSGLRNRDENRKPTNTSRMTGNKSVNEREKRLRSHDDANEQTFKSGPSTNSGTANSETNIHQTLAESDLFQQTRKFQRKKRQLKDPGLPLKLLKEDEAWLNATNVSTINREAFASHNKTRQSSRKKWSDTEDKNLIEGVRIFGEGKWKNILDKFKFSNRTAVNLKDRYRVLKPSYHHKISITSS